MACPLERRHRKSILRGNNKGEVKFLGCGNRILKVKQINTLLSDKKCEIGLQEYRNKSVSFKNMVGLISVSSKYFLQAVLNFGKDSHFFYI